MDAKKLFLYDCYLSLLTATLFCYFGTFFFERLLLKMLCLCHYFLLVFVICWGVYVYDKYSKPNKFWKAVLQRKNIVEAAEFLAVTVFGAYFLTEDRNGLTESAVYMVGFFCLVPRLIQFVLVIYYFSKSCPKRKKADKKQSRRKERSFLGVYFSKDGKCAYGNLREE